MNQGQICMSTERIIVEKSVAEEFARKLAAKGGALKVGDPLSPDSQLGCLINPGAVKRVQELVDDAVAKGAKVLTGGKANGPCYPPTVVFGVTPAMRMYGEESFGPAKPIVIAERRRGRAADRQRHRLRPFQLRLHHATSTAPCASPKNSNSALPHQRRHRLRRAPDALRRHESQRLRQIRRPCGPTGIHRAALGHHSPHPDALPDLTPEGCSRDSHGYCQIHARWRTIPLAELPYAARPRARPGRRLLWTFPSP